MKVDVDIFAEDVDGETGIREGLRIICTRCGHAIEVYGIGDGSARRGAFLLRQECPEGEDNYYNVDWW